MNCEWTIDDPDWNLYETSCGQSFITEEGTVEENAFKYCPYCGKEIKVITEEEEDEIT